jgi:transposase
VGFRYRWSADCHGSPLVLPPPPDDQLRQAIQVLPRKNEATAAVVSHLAVWRREIIGSRKTKLRVVAITSERRTRTLLFRYGANTIEREMKTLTPDERAKARRERAVPLLDKLIERAYALQNQVLPSGKLGEALGYLTKQWPKLARYIEDGRLEIDTNLAENAIRPFARGRRAWLFADSVSGAKASAMLFSLVETAKANGLEPYAYLRRLFERLQHANTVADYEALLPFAAFATSSL